MRGRFTTNSSDGCNVGADHNDVDSVALEEDVHGLVEADDVYFCGHLHVNTNSSGCFQRLMMTMMADDEHGAVVDVAVVVGVLLIHVRTKVEPIQASMGVDERQGKEVDAWARDSEGDGRGQRMEGEGVEAWDLEVEEAEVVGLVELAGDFQGHYGCYLKIEELARCNGKKERGTETNDKCVQDDSRQKHG